MIEVVCEGVEDNSERQRAVVGKWVFGLFYAY